MTEDNTMYQFSSRSRSIKNQGPRPSLDFAALTFGFAMHYYQLNLAFALVGWFCVRTIATNLNLVEWFDRLLIELDWRLRWLIRARERPTRKPPDKTTNKKQRIRFTTNVFNLVSMLMLPSSAFISKSITFDESSYYAIKGRMVRALPAIETHESVAEVKLREMQSRKSTTTQATIIMNAKDIENGFISTFRGSLFVKATDIIVGESICKTTTATWHSNQRSTSMVIAKHDIPFDNQPYLAMQQTTHSTRQNDYLTDATLSIISIYDDICDATNDLVGDGASVVDQFNGGGRGPSLLYDLQQKQSFESLDDIKGFRDNDTITSMASHSSATSFATSVFEEDQLDSRRARFCCIKLRSFDHVTIKDFAFSGTDHDSWLIVVSDTASQFHSELDQHIFDDDRTFTDPEIEKRIASYKHTFGNAPTCNNFLDSGLGRPQLSSAANCFARELVSRLSMTKQFMQEVLSIIDCDRVANLARTNDGVGPISYTNDGVSLFLPEEKPDQPFSSSGAQWVGTISESTNLDASKIRQQIISLQAQIRQQIISLQNGDNEGASPALGSLPISWKGSVALPAISNEGAASAQGSLPTSFSNEGASPALDSNEGICSPKRLICFFSSALHENALFSSRRSTEGVTMPCQLGHFSYKIIYGGIAPSALTNNWSSVYKLLQFCSATRIAFVSEGEM